jgi:hypothetical protein
LQRKLGTEREQHVCLPGAQFIGGSEGLRHALVDPAMFDEEIPALRETELAQVGEKKWVRGFEGRTVERWANHADARERSLLLRMRRERQCRGRAAERG